MTSTTCRRHTLTLHLELHWMTEEKDRVRLVLEESIPVEHDGERHQLRDGFEAAWRKVEEWYREFGLEKRSVGVKFQVRRVVKHRVRV